MYAEKIIEETNAVFEIATTGFSGFYKEAEEKSSGDYSTAASSGDSSTAASSGDYSTAASSGRHSKAASSGYSSTAASSGYSSTAASSGYSSTAASSGYSSKAASSGDYSKAASSGTFSKAASSGEVAGCAAIGYRAAVRGDVGNLIMASEYKNEGGKIIPVGGKADLVDGKKLKAGCWYIVENNEWVEVDFTDGLFARVLSSRSGVKKVKTEDGKILYIVTSGEFSAHGDSIKKAREALLFKAADRDMSAYKGMALDTIKSPIEWAAVYHAITGACEAGCRNFMGNRGSLKSTYSLAEILKETHGQYGHDRFKEVVAP